MEILFSQKRLLFYSICLLGELYGIGTFQFYANRPIEFHVSDLFKLKQECIPINEIVSVWLTIAESKAGADAGFPVGGGANTPGGGRQHTNLPDFPKNCMRLRKFWSMEVRGPHQGCPPWIRHRKGVPGMCSPAVSPTVFIIMQFWWKSCQMIDWLIPLHGLAPPHLSNPGSASALKSSFVSQSFLLHSTTFFTS